MDIFQVNSGGANVSIAATTTSQRTALSGSSNGGGQVRVAVGPGASSMVWAYVAFGGDDVTATTDSIPMLASSVEVFTIGQGVTHVAVRTDVGTATMKVTRGLGA